MMLDAHNAFAEDLARARSNMNIVAISVPEFLRLKLDNTPLGRDDLFNYNSLQTHMRTIEEMQLTNNLLVEHYKRSVGEEK